MRYFSHLGEGSSKALFSKRPGDYDKNADPARLRKAIGALLYTPATFPTLAQDLISRRIPALRALSICLEDAIPDRLRAACELNLKEQLQALQAAIDGKRITADELPIIFVRIDSLSTLERLASDFVKYSALITGVILPKVTLENIMPYLRVAEAIHLASEDPFYVLPTLESVELMQSPRRVVYLQTLKERMDAHPGRVLGLRIGATDLCGLYGIRRQVTSPIYHIPLLAHCIADITQVFCLHDAYTVSGPVWEYFSPEQPLIHGLRASLETEGLLRELTLDLQQGLVGKTCIHPTQILPVQAAHVVPHAVYEDAVALLGGDDRAVFAATLGNQMNETRPHAIWAKKTLEMADIYGVYQPNTNASSLMRVQEAREWVG